jgi:hypothetical protein
MLEDPPSRELQERTGRHACVKCLAVIPAEEYFRNDLICDACAAEDEYPLASTPEPREDGGRLEAGGTRKKDE